MQLQRILNLPRTARSGARVPINAGALLALGLAGVWVAVISGLPASLSVQARSWLTFIALLIAPGYFLGEIITWRLDLDWLERLALALLLGVAVMAVPGMVALLGHQTIQQLTVSWGLVAVLIVLIWLLHALWVRARLSGPPQPWFPGEIVFLLLLAATFGAIVPTLSLAKIDGDAYAVGSFVADALAGRPLNLTEPLFGTDLGPGVRMVFNQSLPMTYLWSYLSGIDAITLTATASRSMLALWAILATYSLGKAAGAGSRRLGLFTAAVQLLIYLAAPFLRDDNVSLFFFERINADKFMVPVTMLPVIFALAIRFVREGRRSLWIAAAVATFAVSVIHPLVAAMLALGLAAFAGLHLVLHPRTRAAYLRAFALAGLVAIVMAVPAIQLAMAREEAPLAPSYPNSVEGWPLGQKMVPALPFYWLPTLDLSGPLPELTHLTASDANTSTNPFLIWRFAVNMTRRRLILFDLNRYISDPSLILEPPYLLALVLLPLLLWRLRSNVAAQFAVGTTLALLVVMFSPVATPLIGSLVMPWILWRLVWVLPYALIIALAADRLLGGAVALLTRWPRLTSARSGLHTAALLAVTLLAALLLYPGIAANIRNLEDRAAFPSFFPTPEPVLAHLKAVTARTGPVTVLADQALSVTIPAYVANANVVAHRAPTISEVFPADQQDQALQRLIDQDAFFRARHLTADSVAILERYDVRYVIAPTGSDLETQLRLAPQWFRWLMDDQAYSLYEVSETPTVNATIQGNTAMAEREWAQAQRLYQAALKEQPEDLLALLGLADAAHLQGQFDAALAALQQAASRIELPVLHYRLGQFYAERGQVERSLAEFDQAQKGAPTVARFHLALGDACLSAGQHRCAAEQYAAAVAAEGLPDEAGRLTALAELWRQRARIDRALPLYEQAVTLRPDEYNLFLLVRAYRDTRQFDRAEALLRQMQAVDPLSPEVVASLARVAADRGETEQAIELYRRAIWLQEAQAQETASTHLALAQTLFEANRLDEAQAEIEWALSLQPNNPATHKLQGDLHRTKGLPDQATAAYQRALQLDPSQVAIYAALSEQYRQTGRQPDDVLALFRTAAQVTPDEATLYLGLGDQLQLRGDTRAAVAAYQAALALLDPYTPSPRVSHEAIGRGRAFAYARLAGAHEDLGQVGPALNYYRAAVSADPASSWSAILLGNALRRHNDVAAAEAAYRQAIRRDPASAEAYLRLADLVEARGDRLAADALRAQAGRAARHPADQDQQAQNRPGGSSSVPTTGLPASALASDESLSRDRARAYQATGRTEDAIRLFLQNIQERVADGASPSRLARTYKDLGDAYLTQEQLNQAVEAYRQAIALDGWWPGPRLGLARALTAQGKPVEARREIQTAVEVVPGSVEAQLALARALAEQGQAEQALTVYRAMARAHPGNTHANLALARAWEERGRLDQAERSYTRALALAPGLPDAYVGLARLHIARSDDETAESLLRQAVEIDRRIVSAYIALAEVAHRQGDRDQAVRWYDQLLALGPHDRAATIDLIDSLFRQGHIEKARKQAQQGVERWPEEGAFRLRLGRVLRTLGRYREAESALVQAARLSSTDSTPYAELAVLYRSEGRPTAAIAAYEQAIARQPTEESYALALGLAWAAQGQPARALAALKSAIVSASHPAPVYAALAAFHLQQGAPELALETLEQGIKRVGDESQLLRAVGDYHRSRAEFERAEAMYQRALAVHPNDPDAHIALGDFYLQRGRAEDAVDQYHQAAALERNTPADALALARAFQRSDQTVEATAYYSQALALAPTLPEAFAGLASVYQDAERWDEARAVYERGLAVAPNSGYLLTRYGAFLLRRDEKDRALAVMDRAVRVSPTVETFIARARLFVDLERAADAERDLQAALALEPGSTEALLALGDLSAAQDNLAGAAETYRQITKLTPGAAVGYLRLAKVASEQGDREEARRQFEAALKAEPDAAEPLARLGEALKAE